MKPSENPQASPVRNVRLEIAPAERSLYEDRLREQPPVAALQLQEQQYQTLINAIPQLVWITTAEGMPCYFNQQWLNYTAYSVTENLDENWAYLLHSEDQARAAAAWMKAVETGEPYEVEYRLRRYDGIFRWFLVRGVPVRDENGTILQWFGSCTDIDRSKRDEEKQHFLVRLAKETRALASPEETMWTAMQLLGEYLQAARTTYNLVDEEKDQVTAKRDYCREGESILGTFPLSAFGTALLEDLRAGHTAIIADTATDARTASAFETMYRRIGVRSFIAAPLLKEGRLMSILSVNMLVPRTWKEEEVELVEEVAERTWLAVENARLFQAVQLSVEYNNRLAAIVASSDDAIVSKDLNGIVTSWNAAAERIYGYSAAEIVGKSKALVIPPDLPNELSSILNKIRAGERIEHYDTMRRRKDGTLIQLSISVSPVRDASGQIIGAATIARDISERKQLERRLSEETKTLEMIYGVGQRLAAELDVEKIVQAATDAATELTGAQFGAFFYNVVNAAGESYMLYTISGVPREAFSQFPMPRNTAVFAPTFAGEGTVRLDDVTKDSRYGKTAPYHGKPPGHLPVVSYLAVPVVSRSGEVLGGLFFGHEQPGVFTERHEHIVEGLAAQAAIAIDNARLFQAERERSEQLARAVREVHHRVKNSLQGATALLEMQIVTDATMLPLAAVQDSLNRIKAIALVHDLLAHDQPIGRVDAALVLTKLVSMLSITMGTSEKPLPILLETASLWIPIKAAIALALVINELVTNAVKHSITPPTKDSLNDHSPIQVCLRQQEEYAYVSVQDNGPGFPLDFDPILHAHIGLELVQTLVTNDLKGNITFSNRVAGNTAETALDERGARVEITFSPARLPD